MAIPINPTTIWGWNPTTEKPIVIDVDSATHALSVTDYITTRAHHGFLYMYKDFWIQQPQDEIEILVIPGDTLARAAHSRFVLQSDVNVRLQIYEDSTYTGLGTAYAEVNQNRNFADDVDYVSTLKVYQPGEFTRTGYGTLLSDMVQVPTSAGAPIVEDFILKADTPYIWRMTSMGGGSNPTTCLASPDWVQVNMTYTPDAGDNRVLLVMAAWEASDGDASQITSMTYGGQAMTLIERVDTGSGYDTFHELWYLNEAGLQAASSTTLAVSYDSEVFSQGPIYAAGTLKNVDQCTPINDTGTNSTAASTPNPLTVAINGLERGQIISTTVSGNSGSFIWNNGWSELLDLSVDTMTLGAGDICSHDDQSYTASATHSNQNRRTVVAAAFNPSRFDSTLSVEFRWYEYTNQLLI